MRSVDTAYHCLRWFAPDRGLHGCWYGSLIAEVDIGEMAVREASGSSLLEGLGRSWVLFAANWGWFHPSDVPACQFVEQVW